MNLMARLTTLLSIFILLALSQGALAKDTLSTNEQLNRGQSIVSPHGGVILEMRMDGLLYLHKDDGAVIWVMRGGGDSAVMQADGNFVEYTSGMVPLWASGSNVGGCCANASLQVTDDGQLQIIYPNANGGTSIAWQLGTAYAVTSNQLAPGMTLSSRGGYSNAIVSRNGIYYLAAYNDSVVVITSGYATLQGTLDTGSIYSATMQNDGNFVVYHGPNFTSPGFNTGTWGCCTGSIAYLTISMTGDLSLFRDGTAAGLETLWQWKNPNPPLTTAPTGPTNPPASTTQTVYPLTQLSPPGDRPVAPALWSAPAYGDSFINYSSRF